MKKIFGALLLTVVTLTFMCGCGENDDTVQTYKLANEAYEDAKEMEAATDLTEIAAGSDVYLSMDVIESPKGMEYMVKWYIDGNVVFSQTQATKQGPQDVLIFTLEGSMVTKGTLKVEILYKDAVLRSKVAIVQ